MDAASESSDDDDGVVFLDDDADADGQHQDQSQGANENATENATKLGSDAGAVNQSPQPVSSVPVRVAELERELAAARAAQRALAAKLVRGVTDSSESSAVNSSSSQPTTADAPAAPVPQHDPEDQAWQQALLDGNRRLEEELGEARMRIEALDAAAALARRDAEAAESRRRAAAKAAEAASDDSSAAAAAAVAVAESAEREADSLRETILDMQSRHAIKLSRHDEIAKARAAELEASLAEADAMAQAVREEAQAKAAAAASAASAAWEAKHSESARELAKAREEMNELRTRAGRLEAGAATLGNAHSDVQRLTAELDTLRAMSRRDLEEKERTIARLTGDLEMALGGPLTDSQSLRAATSSSTSSASGDVGSAMETTFTFTRRPETPVLAFMALLLIAVIILIVEYGGAAMCALEAMGIYLGAGCGSGSALAASKASAIADATQGDTAERDLGVLAG